MNLNFTPQALDDLVAIRTWIAQDNLAAADRVISRIRQTAIMCASFPMLGRPGRVQGTRELTVTGLPYLIVYQLTSETELDVVTVVHTRRHYPTA